MWVGESELTAQYNFFTNNFVRKLLFANFCSQLTLGRLIAADDSALCFSDQLPLGLGQAQGAQGEQHEALHVDKCGKCGGQSV